MARRSRKGESAKTDAITVRLSPKLKYALELLARKQHRTIAGTVEWSIERLLKTDDGLGYYQHGPLSKPQEMVDLLWSPNEFIRLLKLAEYSPSLLTYEEQLVWGSIANNAYYWRVRPPYKNRPNGKSVYGDQPPKFTWQTWAEDDLLIDRVQKDYETLKAIGLEEASRTDLPIWVEPQGALILNQGETKRTLTEYLLYDISQDNVSELVILDTYRPPVEHMVEMVNTLYSRLASDFQEKGDTEGLKALEHLVNECERAEKIVSSKGKD